MPQRSPKKPSPRAPVPSGRRKPFKLHHFLFPHKRNGYKPHVFRAASVTAIVMVVLLLQAAYLAQVKLVLPKTNYLAAVLPTTLIDLTNSDRSANGVQPVAENPLLNQAAQEAADDMASKGYFAHISPDGKSPWYWLNTVGYSYAYAGENLAVNFTDSDQVETAWMNSPTHRANIVKADYTQIGIGTANGMYEGKEVTFVVQFFASPANAGGASEQATPPVQTAPAESAGSGKIALVPQKGSANVSKQADIATGVLGTETQKPASGKATAPASAPSSVTAPSGAAIFFGEILTSPTHVYLYVLAVLASIVLLLLVIEFLVKARLRYVEVTGGGLVLLVFLLVLMIYTTTSQPHVQVAAQGSATTASTGV